MFAGSINKGISLDGYVANGLVNTSLMNQRHDELVEEMTARGMTHKSPLQEFIDPQVGAVNPNVSIEELKKRCPRCRELILNDIIS
jgi:hypothetical protein